MKLISTQNIDKVRERNIYKRVGDEIAVNLKEIENQH